MYTYEYPHPAVTVDCVIFGYAGNKLNVLLIKRKGEPYRSHLALPGGYLDLTETCEAAAARELKEETGLETSLTQLHTFSDVHRDPRERTISVTYYGEVSMKEVDIVAGDDAEEVDWFPVYNLPEKIAFDHKKIIEHAAAYLREKTRTGPVGLQLLTEYFRFNDVHKMYEAILNRKLNRILFKNKIDRMGHLLKTEENVTRNPILKFNTELYNKLLEEGYHLTLD
ncbi:NUDIX hydrolase [Cytophagaceae bacterium ABcell3]|nr:NUDIX hydrolase [Cytophagaceae bacterium ABcell3]